MTDIRTFAFVAIDEFDQAVERVNLDYVEIPKNLGFELKFTSLESRLTDIITSAREVKLPITLTVNFLGNAYHKANEFKRFVQKYTNKRLLLEYNDTQELKYWEGKIQKFGQEELAEWGGLSCPISFLPTTPRFLLKNNRVSIERSTVGKSYSFAYPYAYGQSYAENNIVDNTYFDEVPLRITLYGSLSTPQIFLQDMSTEELYSSVRFDDLYLKEDEHLIIDAIQSKILLYRGGKYISAYDYVSKAPELNSFLHARANTASKILINIDPRESGSLQASYRQYTL